MEVIEPTRLASLEPQRVEVFEHRNSGKPPGLIHIEPVYGFTTMADLKRQVWIHHGGDPQWAPSRQWLAYKLPNDLYMPIDMTWATLSKGLPSPFAHPGQPDPRLVDATGARKAVYPTINEGLLFETLFDKKPELHVWNLDTIIRLIGTKMEEKGVFEGYIQLYFPKIKTKAEALEDRDESYAAAENYMRLRNERIATIDTILASPQVSASEPFRLRQLRRWVATFPPLDKTKSLDILFYEFKTSQHLPFLRFYPANGRGDPLLKLAVGPSGFPVISDADMLDTFITDEPLHDYGAVLVAKIPFPSLSSEVRATRNVALSIYWLEDGTATAILEAPRRDMLLERSVYEEANTLLKAALTSVGYSRVKIHMEELSATYRIEVPGPKLTHPQLTERISFFSPFIEASAYQPSASKISMKWKAVNNYEQEGAVYAYLTKRVLDDDAEGETEERIRTFVAEIMKEFGRSEADAKRLFEDWFRRRTDVAPGAGTGDVVAAHNTGVDIEITLSHPVYFVSLVGIDSEKTFKRVMSILTAYFYYKEPSGRNAAAAAAAAVAPVPVPKAPVVDVVAAPVAVAAKANPEAARWLDLLGNDDEEESEAEEEQPQAQAQAQAQGQAQAQTKGQAHAYGPAPTNAQRQTLEPLKEWYKSQLDRYDDRLFGYSQTDKTVTVYSRTCQASSARQPNILVAEQLDALVAEYGTEVEWVFLPPPANIILDVGALSNKELIDEMIKRGFTDIVDEKGKPLKKKAELKDLFEKTLCAENSVQGQFCRILRKGGDAPTKPLWFIARAGSNPEKPYYFICPEYWCVRDGKPIIPAEFEGQLTRQGQSKARMSCPFCGGKIIEDVKKPAQGETVIKRKGKPGKGEIHGIAGYMDNIHPSKFALPCCFTSATVTQMKPADGTEPLPQDTRKGLDVRPAAAAAEQDEDDDTTSDVAAAAVDEDAELTKILRTIRTQYVLGQEKRKLDPGRIGLPPPALDALLGQVGATSIKKEGGVSQHLNPKTAKLFLRFGLGNLGASPGLNFLELLGFYLGNLQRAGKPPVKGAKIDLPTVLKPHAVLKALFPDEPSPFTVNLRRAFERANYGNLVHEFAGLEQTASAAQIQNFAREQGLDLTKNRPHIVRLVNAWYNFKRYMEDDTAAKNLKHFENLFATPNVIFPEGLLLVVFEGTTDPETGEQSVTIRCPEYGVSQFSQQYRPPVAFLWHDLATMVYEPLIYVEALDKLDKKKKPQFLMLPTIHPESAKFAQIAPQFQAGLKDFIDQYAGFAEGCGRYSSPSHPWMPTEPSTTIPKLSELLTLKIKDLTPHAVLRDRSNRLVGIIYNAPSDSQVYIPAIEDGSLGLTLTTLYDIEGLPKPNLDLLLTALNNKTGLHKFAGLRPVEILVEKKEQRYVALRLASGAIVPFNPFPLTSTATHPQFTELAKKGAVPVAILPWTEDARFLKMSQISSETLEIVPEAVIEEAYQYLRLSLSEWLKSQEGRGMLKQLNALRKSHLPLYELRRRGDILIEPLVTNWVDATPHDAVVQTLPLLRRNCRVAASQETCTSNPLCSWIGDECRIHSGTSEKIPNVKVYFTSRLVDELFRYPSKAREILTHKVGHIRNPIGLVRTEDGLLTSKTKIRDLVDELGLDYVPNDAHSAGLTYPEEAHDETIGRPKRADFIDIPTDWKKAGLQRLPADPTIEDRFATSIQLYTGETLKAVEAKVLATKKKQVAAAAAAAAVAKVRWTEADWWCFSKAYNLDLFVAQYNHESGQVRITKFYNAKSGNYAVALMINGPEMLLSTKKPLNLADLPPAFRSFMDSGFASNWESVMATA